MTIFGWKYVYEKKIINYKQLVENFTDLIYSNMIKKDLYMYVLNELKKNIYILLFDFKMYLPISKNKK